MTEEKPSSEEIEQDSIKASEATQETAASSASDVPDSVLAALSALSSAATPIRDEEPSSGQSDAAAPEEAVVTFTPAPSAPSAASESSLTPPPDPAPKAPAPAASTDASEAKTPTQANVSTAMQTPPPPPAPESVREYPAPTSAPIAVNTASAAATPPAPVKKRKKWLWILAICIVAGLLLVGGMLACASTVMRAYYDDVMEWGSAHEYDDLYTPDAQNGMYGYRGKDATFEGLLSIFDVDEGRLSPAQYYEEGIYRVGGENGIDPGLYYLDGDEREVSYFFLFHTDDPNASEPRYNLTAAVEYFGNGYVDLTEGDVFVYTPCGILDTFKPVKGPMDVIPPYQNGCYRVGIDIPAGTYTITLESQAAAQTDSEAGAFIMKDALFNENSVERYAYVIKGGRQTITVEDGQYLELFAAIATPATASTNVPLQPAESESSHAA